MKIGELARVTSTQVETVRYYEREGLLPTPARTDGNFRIYEGIHVERLSFIRHCRSLDMTLDEIRVLLRFKDAPAENCEDVNTLLEKHIGHVAARIRDASRAGATTEGPARAVQRSRRRSPLRHPERVVTASTP